MAPVFRSDKPAMNSCSTMYLSSGGRASMVSPSTSFNAAVLVRGTGWWLEEPGDSCINISSSSRGRWAPNDLALLNPSGCSGLYGYSLRLDILLPSGP